MHRPRKETRDGAIRSTDRKCAMASNIKIKETDRVQCAEIYNEGPVGRATVALFRMGQSPMLLDEAGKPV
jgi:hypothetical protein